MDSKVLDAIGSAVKEVIEAMTMSQITLGEPKKKESRGMYGSVTGIIGLAGGNSNGTLALSFKQDCLFQLLENMLGEKFTTVNDDVLDAVGEFTNIICGDLKRRLAVLGFEIGLATPLVISGESLQMRDRVTRDTYCIICSVAGGTFAVETNLARI
jgi:chemotaxis protein CheX